MTNSIFDALKNYKLTRDEDGRYTLENHHETMDLDHLFGLDTITLNPGEQQMTDFATICYLYGILGINVTNFTAIPAGYIASFEKNGKFCGTFMSYPPYAIQDLKEKFQDKYEQDGNQFYRFLSNFLDDDSLSLTDKVLYISQIINNTPLIDIQENINRALEMYDKANQQNCADNHLILEDIVSASDEILADLHQVNLMEPNIKNDLSKYDRVFEVVEKKSFASQRDKNIYLCRLIEAKYDYDTILSSFILESGYYVYRGKNKKQDGNVLNDTNKVGLLRSLLGKDDVSEENKAVVDILNMCATDYSADIVYDIFKKIAGANQLELKEEVPKVENNEQSKANFRRENSSLMNTRAK